MTSPSLICGAFVLALIASYVSVYLFFPQLHINNAHYQIENVIFLCAAVAIVVDALLLSRYYVAGYFILAATVATQVWTLHAGPTDRDSGTICASIPTISPALRLKSVRRWTPS